MTEDLLQKRIDVLFRELEDIKQTLEADLLDTYEERILEFLVDKGEMREDDTWFTLPLRKQSYRQKDNDELNAFSRWMFWSAFQSLKAKGRLEIRHHGKGHRLTYTLSGG